MSELLKKLEKKVEARKYSKPIKRPLPKRPIIQIVEKFLDRPRPIETVAAFLYQLAQQKLAYAHSEKPKPLQKGEKPTYAV